MDFHHGPYFAYFTERTDVLHAPLTFETFAGFHVRHIDIGYNFLPHSVNTALHPSHHEADRPILSWSAEF